MTRVILHGCNGAMGQVIAKLAQADDEIIVAAGLDIEDKGLFTFPVYTSPEKCMEEADVVIDFSTARAVDSLLDWCAARKLPLVLCTTGLSEAQLEHMRKVSEETAVLRSANMSLGVNLLLALVKEAAKTLAPNGFDIEILEKHHRRKIDAPSGTAIALADSINEAMDGAYHYRLRGYHTEPYGIFQSYFRKGRRHRGEVPCRKGPGNVFHGGCHWNIMFGSLLITDT